MQKLMITISAVATLLTGGAYAVADYTWMASPADANWNANSLNWNSGAAWVDDASAPNNALFLSSSQKTITIPSGETRHVNNMTVGGANYTFSGGDIGLNGTLLVTNTACTINSRIAAKKASGLDYSTSTRVTFNSKSSAVMDPGAGVTNIVGAMTITGKLTLSSGVTQLGAAANATGDSAMLYVVGNWNNFNTSSIGILEVAGGTLYATQQFFVDTRQYAQVTVKDGGKVVMPSAEWLNGLYNPSRLTVSNGGEFRVSTLRACSGYASQVNLNEGGLIAVRRIVVVNSTKQTKFLFNGGSLQSRDGVEDFLNANVTLTEDQWNATIKFAVGAGGAVFDASNGQPVFWTRPLVSDAANDGGVRKFGTGILVFKHTNDYNGPTVVQSGGVQLRVDNALPPGSTVRLGAANAYIDGGTYDNSHPYSEQWISRVEGIGQVKWCENMHITNSVAPAVNEVIDIQKALDLRGDYEIAADANGCGCIKVAKDQDISNLTLKVVDISALNKDAARETYKILDAPNGYTGTFAVGNLPEPWYVKYTETATYLVYKKGMVLILK